MAIAYTSRIALKGIERELSGRRLEVYALIRDWRYSHGPSIADIARTLNRKECSVCARINELREAGAIEDGPLKRALDTGKMVKTYTAIVYREPERTGQLPLFQ